MGTIIIEHVEATIRAILVKPQKRLPPSSVQSVKAVEGGFEGDHHTGTKRRQILLISGSVLDELALAPGAVFENVVVDGMDVMTLREGQRLQLGDARVEVTIPCEPCMQMERVRVGLQEALHYRRGMFVRVIVPGEVRVGDRVYLEI